MVVAPEYTSPVESTARPPVERDDNLSDEVNVDEAVERRPCRNPRVVVVELPQEVGVQANGE